MILITIVKRVGLVLGLIVLLVTSYVCIMAYRLPPIESADAIVVLGAAVNSPSFYNRTLAAIDLYKQGKAPVIIVTGGTGAGRRVSEAEAMRRLIVEQAPNAQVIVEDQSRNTIENITNAKAELPNAARVIIVSDRYHLGRSVLLARLAGYDQVYWTGPKPFYYAKEELVYQYVREIAGVIITIPRYVLGI